MSTYGCNTKKSIADWWQIEQALLDFFRSCDAAIEAADGESNVSVLLKHDTDNLGHITVYEADTLTGRPDADRTREIDCITLSDIARAIVDRLAGTP
jgi:hypothetical protein